MASISYTSFPPVGDSEPGSPSLISLDQLRMAGDNSPLVEVDDMNPVDISESVVEDEEEDTTAEFRSLDCAGYHHHLVVPITPTKERSRRATMPEPSKPRPQDVSSLSPSSPSFITSRRGIHLLVSIFCLPFYLCIPLRSQMLIIVDRPHFPSPNSQNRSPNSKSGRPPPT